MRKSLCDLCICNRQIINFPSGHHSHLLPKGLHPVHRRIQPKASHCKPWGFHSVKSLWPQNLFSCLKQAFTISLPYTTIDNHSQQYLLWKYNSPYENKFSVIEKLAHIVAEPCPIYWVVQWSVKVTMR